MKKMIGLLLGLGALALQWPGLAQAQDYPTRPITMIMPFPPGGPSDVAVRIVTDAMSRALGTAIVIENVSGAGGTIGTARAAQAAADGYTLLGASMGSHVAATALYPALKYDSTKDFAPIGLIANAPAVVVARSGLGAKNLREFIAYVRKNGADVRQGHGGIGSSSHMACLLFNAAAGLKPNAIPYRGTGPALNDLIGGHIDYFCEQVIGVLGAIENRTVKAYVVSGSTRSPAIPDVPSAAEAGLPNYRLNIWSAILATQGTPKPILAKLDSALNEALDDPTTVKRLADLGGSVPAMSERGPQHLEMVLKADIARWNPLLKQAMAAERAQ
jgi:tripartite-type tricarboxylate transporter receptor subunit TctC